MEGGKMEARTWAWILSVPLVTAGSVLKLLAMDRVLAMFLTFGMYTAAFFLVGFALSADARPPRVLPRTGTVKSVLLVPGCLVLVWTMHVLRGEAVPEFLTVCVFETSVCFLGAFAARRYDSHRPPRPEASYDVILREYNKYHKTENEPENPA